MRKFNVEIEGTRFELEVQEYKQVPLIRSLGSRTSWAENAHAEIVNNYPVRN